MLPPPNPNPKPPGDTDDPSGGTANPRAKWTLGAAVSPPPVPHPKKVSWKIPKPYGAKPNPTPVAKPKPAHANGWTTVLTKSEAKAQKITPSPLAKGPSASPPTPTSTSRSTKSGHKQPSKGSPPRSPTPTGSGTKSGRSTPPPRPSNHRPATLHTTSVRTGTGGFDRLLSSFSTDPEPLTTSHVQVIATLVLEAEIAPPQARSHSTLDALANAIIASVPEGLSFANLHSVSHLPPPTQSPPGAPSSSPSSSPSSESLISQVKFIPSSINREDITALQLTLFVSTWSSIKSFPNSQVPVSRFGKAVAARKTWGDTKLGVVHYEVVNRASPPQETILEAVGVLASKPTGKGDCHRDFNNTVKDALGDIPVDCSQASFSTHRSGVHHKTTVLTVRVPKSEADNARKLLRVLRVLLVSSGYDSYVAVTETHNESRIVFNPQTKPIVADQAITCVKAFRDATDLQVTIPTAKLAEAKDIFERKCLPADREKLLLQFYQQVEHPLVNGVPQIGTTQLFLSSPFSGPFFKHGFLLLSSAKDEIHKKLKVSPPPDVTLNPNLLFLPPIDRTEALAIVADGKFAENRGKFVEECLNKSSPLPPPSLEDAASFHDSTLARIQDIETKKAALLAEAKATSSVASKTPKRKRVPPAALDAVASPPPTTLASPVTKNEDPEAALPNTSYGVPSPAVPPPSPRAAEVPVALDAVASPPPTTGTENEDPEVVAPPNTPNGVPPPATPPPSPPAAEASVNNDVPHGSPPTPAGTEPTEEVQLPPPPPSPPPRPKKRQADRQLLAQRRPASNTDADNEAAPQTMDVDDVPAAEEPEEMAGGIAALNDTPRSPLKRLELSLSPLTKAVREGYPSGVSAEFSVTNARQRQAKQRRRVAATDMDYEVVPPTTEGQATPRPGGLAEPTAEEPEEGAGGIDALNDAPPAQADMDGVTGIVPPSMEGQALSRPVPPSASASSDDDIEVAPMENLNLNAKETSHQGSELR